MPATVAVLSGRIRIGLDEGGLNRLTHGPAIAKLSRRDLPVALATGGDGATTGGAATGGRAVSATGGGAAGCAPGATTGTGIAG